MAHNYRSLSKLKLSIDDTMLTLIKGIRVVEQYHDLFFSSLGRDDVKRLTIEMSEKLPTMVDALCSIDNQVGTRVY